MARPYPGTKSTTDLNTPPLPPPATERHHHGATHADASQPSHSSSAWQSETRGGFTVGSGRKSDDRGSTVPFEVSVPVLIVQSGPRTGQRLPIEGERVVIGRHPACAIVLDSSSVSRQHAAITRRDDGFWVEDLRSRNGTAVNGEPLVDPRPLRDGDTLTISEQRIRFLIADEPMTQMPLGDGGAGEMELGPELLDSSSGDSVIMSRVDIALPGREAAWSSTCRRAMAGLDRAIGRSLSLEEVLPALLDGLFEIFPGADRGFVMLRDTKSRRLVLRAKKLRSKAPPGPLKVSLSLIERVVATRQAILSADTSSDSRFRGSESIVNCQITSMLCVPVVADDGEVIGIVQVDSLDVGKAFTPEDLELLASIAGRAAEAIEQARSHDRRVAQEQLKRDLAIAHRVQQALLPSRPPEIPGYELFDYYEPAREIGGDFFSYVPLPDGRIAIVLADVSGKGVSAALVMAALSSDVRYCLASEPDPAKAVGRINESFCRSGWDDRFATLFVAVLDAKRHRLTAVNAGHLPGILRHARGDSSGQALLEEVGIEGSGLPLGFDPEQVYRSREIELEPGAMFVLFTDGISEAMDQEQEIYGFERVSCVLSGSADSAAALGERLLADVERHAAGQVRSDDMCIVCLGRTGTDA